MTESKSNAGARIAPAGLMFLAITSVGWGFNWPVTKYLLSELPPLTLRGSTGVIGAALLAVLALARSQSLKVERHLWPRLMLAALLNVTGWMVLMGLALLWLPASEAALIAYTMPVWASLLAWPVLGERPTVLRTVALVMAFAGLAAIMGGQTSEMLPDSVDVLFEAAHWDPVMVSRTARRHRLLSEAAKRWETAIVIAADPGRGLADRAGMLADRLHRSRLRNHAYREGDPARLVAADLFDRDPVLHRLCQLVCRARPPAGLGGRDRHHGGARHRRRRIRDRAGRAARADADRGAGVHAGRRGAGDKVIKESLPFIPSWRPAEHEISACYVIVTPINSLYATGEISAPPGSAHQRQFWHQL